MKCSKRDLLRSISGFLCFALSATASSLSLQSTPEINVLVYGSPAVSGWMLQGAEAEATRMLRPAQLQLNWINCGLGTGTVRCTSPRPDRDLIVRFVSKAFPGAGRDALGVSASAAGYATTFIFVDRVLALRTYTRSVPPMLGRVLAHEIVHLLVPGDGHSPFGLMRGEWSVDDLRIASLACLGLTARSIRLIRREALRKTIGP